MLEESVWAYMNSWFTPALLFLFLNIMIGTIAIVSSIGTKKHHEQKQQQPHLARVPSVLDRLKSFNLYSYRSDEVKNIFPSITTTTFQEQQQQPTEVEEDTQQTLEQSTHELKEIIDQNPDDNDDDDDEIADHHHHQVTRTKSETKPSSGDMPLKLPQNLKKSGSEKSVFGHFEEVEEKVEHRPSTVREGKSEIQRFGDEGVDAKADDFINRFKQQLKLQRLDSIIRYKNLLGKGHQI